MRYAHTVDQVRMAEAALMATLPQGALMQRAAFGLATACASFMGGGYGARVLLLIGSGDNGGDALYAGAYLARRGASVEALLLSSSAHVGGLDALGSAGGRVVGSIGDPDLVIDGIVGIGGRGGLRPNAAAIVEALESPVVSVDIPSGIGVDTGEREGSAVAADLTVTFGTHKVGLLVDPSSANAGIVELVDIGLGPHLGAPAVEALQDDDLRALLPTPPGEAQKYSRGVLGVAAGSPSYTGAALLATQAAVAAGFAGMVRYQGAAADLIRARLPEVVIGSGRVQAWVVGPGLGDAGEAASVVSEVLADNVPTVVDADGLTHLPAQFAQPAVLTPHAGELARMLGHDRDVIEASPLQFAREAAERWQAVVLLKGRRTLIASPSGSVRVNHSGVAWLATAGAGDVLSGLIGSLLAAGLSPFDAASAGAWLHGSAATLASRGGPISAEAVAAALPAAIRPILR